MEGDIVSWKYSNWKLIGAKKTSSVEVNLKNLNRCLIKIMHVNFRYWIGQMMFVSLLITAFI